VQTMTTSAVGSATFQYDADGDTISRPANGTSGPTQTLTWNYDGSLDTTTDATGTTKYLYDADGDRLIKRDPTQRTLYLGSEELRAGTSGTPTGTRYISHAGQIVATRTAAGLVWQTNDHQGTGVAEINASTLAVVRRYQTPFGTERGNTSPWLTDKGFIGGTEDGTLTHLGAREYDATTGRFVSVDPLIDMADPQQMQGYNYAAASPVTFSDPSGKMYMPEDRPPPPRPKAKPKPKPKPQPVYQHYIPPRTNYPPYQHYIPPRQPVYQHYIPPRSYNFPIPKKADDPNEDNGKWYPTCTHPNPPPTYNFPIPRTPPKPKPAVTCDMTLTCRGFVNPSEPIPPKTKEQIEADKKAEKEKEDREIKNAYWPDNHYGFVNVDVCWLFYKCVGLSLGQKTDGGWTLQKTWAKGPMCCDQLGGEDFSIGYSSVGAEKTGKNVTHCYEGGVAGCTSEGTTPDGQDWTSHQFGESSGIGASRQEGDNSCLLGCN
jgi:RHS repeat-associated protein